MDKPKKLSKKEIEEKWKYYEYCKRKNIIPKPIKIRGIETGFSEGDSGFSVYDIPRRH